MKERIFSIDAGSEVSGVVVICGGSVIEYADVLDNSVLVSKIKQFSDGSKLIAIIEDIRPFKTGLAMQTIETAKFIGELKYRLKNELKIDFYLFPRFDVKKWVFWTFSEIVVSRINKKIEYLDGQGERLGRKRYRHKKTGELYKPTMHYVDDRIVIAAMKEYWKIKTPKPGKKNEFGLKSHSWQALALATMYLATRSETQASTSA
jgi:hypothetical protein